MNRYEFEVLSFVERCGPGIFPVRKLNESLCISGSTITRSIESLRSRGCLSGSGDELIITDKGLLELEPYRVKRAIVVGAGLGTRMMPATKDRPKPMVRVNGVRIIDTLLDSLIEAEIKDITVVGGYCFEVMERELKNKYPFLRLINNTKYEKENNISSALLAMDYFYGGCYFCEADLYISNPSVIQKYQYCTNILGSWSVETDDWCFKIKDGLAIDYKKGGSYCYNYYGISYWTEEDCKKLKKDWIELHDEPGGKDLFWEFPALIYRKENYKIEVRPCRKNDIVEIDNYSELAQLDPSYIKE